MIIGNHPGYVGAFTRDQAEGAIPNGTSIVKVKSEPSDGTALGTKGVVLGSIDGEVFVPGALEKLWCRFFYWVEWSNRPRYAVAIVGWKIAEAK